MDDKGFTHLHLHTEYSLLDGAISLKKLFSRCKELGMDAVAMTDHGNMFGAIDFYSGAKANNIKPIIGIEAYIAPGSRFEKQAGTAKDNAYHLILLAENTVGYHNLLKLTSTGYLDGFYYRPRIDKAILAEFNEGLICTSACISGEVARMVESGNMEAAEKAIESYLEIFGKDRFFIEIQQHDGDDLRVRAGLIELAGKMGVELVATNDVHFLREDDYDAHDALTCISTGKIVTDPNRMKYPRDVYLKNSEEMRRLFADVPRACDNTAAIAKRCNIEIDLKTTHAPKYVPENGQSADEYLRVLCYEGAKERYEDVNQDVKARIERELEVIISKGFSSYFLIVWDFCNFAKKNGIPVGARGSGVGTIVGYCLGLCDVDPLRYDLLFERFMDPERNEFPDIDIDICQDGRGKVIEYVRNKYGHVAQIITFGTMKARAVIRDVCRVLDVPLAEADRLAKLIPADLGITLDKAIEIEPQLKEAYKNNAQTRNVIEVARKLEGLSRHAGVHAAGVIVADEPLTNFIPLYKQNRDSEQIITQFEGPMAEKVGLLKMDFLGLRTLSVIGRSVELVKQLHGIDINIEKIDINDQNVFKLFSEGKTKGIFQFESGGMQDMLMKLKPDRIEDLIAANALYRPGPMELIPDYIERKHGAKWDVPHPLMKDILNETFGIMVYQEQVMRICNSLGDIPLRQAYTLIKAISKKSADTIAKQKEQFVKGCTEKGLNANQANDIFELIERFAGYGFNKSHSTRYSFIAYQTAYMKTYWPVEFMAALLTYEMGNTEKIVDYIGEAKAMGIELAPPDINESFTDFTVVKSKMHGQTEDNGLIRFGLGAVKGVGEKAVEQIIEARERAGLFKSLFHFCENTDLRLANKQVLEGLIKGGAFDKLGGSRAQMMMGLETAMQCGSRAQSDTAKGQASLFGAMAGDDFENDHQQLPEVEPWSELDMLQKEKEVLGFYVTSNPLSRHAQTIRAYSSCNTSHLADGKEGHEVIIGGMITKIRNIVTRNGRNAGKKMAVLTLEDLQGDCEVVLFPKTLEAYSELINIDMVVFIKGKVDASREKANILADEVIGIDEVSEKLRTRVKLWLNQEKINREIIEQIKSICHRHKGGSFVNIIVRTPGAIVNTEAKELRVQPDVEFCDTMRELIGTENFELTYA